MRKNGWREGSSKNPSPDVQNRLANPAKLVCSTKEARDVLMNVDLAGKITINIDFSDPEICLRCALRTIYGVKKFWPP
jgi:hypothetical protein